jgi:hypothetical protein
VHAFVTESRREIEHTRVLTTPSTKPTDPNKQLYLDAQLHASKHRAEVEASSRCGCYFCFRTFPPSSIVKWIDAEQTALCPSCGVDSVLGGASSHRLDDRFLRAMHGHFFNVRSKMPR